MKFLICLFISINCYAVEIKTNIATLKVKLQRMSIPEKRIDVDELYSAISICSIDQDLLLSIIRVESSFFVNAFNKHSLDYGLMQISIWHVKRKKLNRVLLLSDIGYNIKHGCKILEWFLKTYKLREAIGRYNCGVRKSCIKRKRVRKYINRVLYYKNILEGL